MSSVMEAGRDAVPLTDAPLWSQMSTINYSNRVITITCSLSLAPPPVPPGLSILSCTGLSELDVPDVGSVAWSGSHMICIDHIHLEAEPVSVSLLRLILALIMPSDY